MASSMKCAFKANGSHKRVESTQTHSSRRSTRTASRQPRRATASIKYMPSIPPLSVFELETYDQNDAFKAHQTPTYVTPTDLHGVLMPDATDFLSEGLVNVLHSGACVNTVLRSIDTAWTTQQTLHLDDPLLVDAGPAPLAVGAAQDDLPVRGAGLLPLDGVDELGGAAAADVEVGVLRRQREGGEGAQRLADRVLLEVDDLDRLARGENHAADVVVAVIRVLAQGGEPL